MLILWGVLFITNKRDEPRLRGRNFKKSAVRGVQRVQSFASGVYTMGSFKVTSSSVRPATCATDDEARPHWDIESGKGGEECEKGSESGSEAGEERVGGAEQVGFFVVVGVCGSTCGRHPLLDRIGKI